MPVKAWVPSFAPEGLLEILRRITGVNNCSFVGGSRSQPWGRPFYGMTPAIEVAGYPCKTIPKFTPVSGLVLQKGEDVDRLIM